MFLKFTRRRRLTILKCCLILFTISGVAFWFNQVWNISFHLDNHPPTNHKLNVEIVSYKTAPQQNNMNVVDQVDRPQDNVLKKAVAENFYAEKEVENENNEIERLNRKYINKDVLVKLIPHQENNVVKPQVPDLKFYDRHMKVTPGLGENGAPVHLPPNEQKLADEEFNSAAFNVYISDRISLNRSVPDPRSSLCSSVKYDEELPSASVVIIFTNEAWSALLRTIYSVINRSPAKFLKEIILIDDFSDKTELKDELQAYLNHHFSPNFVKLKRLSERSGLIRARLAGAKEATGDVLIFLDSHCEVNNQWLEPLLQRIKENRKAVLCPIIDVIDDKTLEYFASNKEYFQIGGFTWSGHFTWIEIPSWEETRRKSSIGATRSPTMAGGLFAIDRNYFWEIGSYDSGMDLWGGENLEMSFRIWMCGGSLEIIPCSHVGHIFRSFHPYSFPGNKDSHGINTARTVEVWLDEYKKYFYKYRRDLLDIDIGDISERLELKQRLKCKSFSWFLENIYPQKFIYDRNVTGYGQVKNPFSKLCLDIMNRDEDHREPLGFYPCHDQNTGMSNQMFSLAKSGQLRREENCAEVDEDESEKKWTVFMTKCDVKKENQEWKHVKGGQLIHVKTAKCLDTDGSKTGDNAIVTDCADKHTQLWWLENYVSPELDIRKSGA